MASVCLFSCQQQEELQDPINGVIDFSTSIDQSINNALTRNSSSLTLPLKSNFAGGVELHLYIMCSLVTSILGITLLIRLYFLI